MAFYTSPPKRDYDYIIVGSGPAGMSLARELSKKPSKSILIIESGTLKSVKKYQALSKVTSSGSLSARYYSSHWRRCFGGTSTAWNGYCAVLSNRAFLTQGWPIDYDELYPYYKAAARVLKLPSAVYENSHCPIENSNIEVRPYYFSPPKRFNDAEESQWLRTSSNVDILLGFTVKEVFRDKDRVTGIECNDFNYNSQKYKVNNLIFACGGIGNVKMLWAVPKLRNDNLGTHFMEHPHIYNKIQLKISKSFLDSMKSKFNYQGRILLGLSLKPDFAVDNNLLSGVFDLNFKKEHFEEDLLFGRTEQTITINSTLRAEMKAVKTNNIVKSNERDAFKSSIPKIGLEFNYTNINNLIDSFQKELIKSRIGRSAKISQVTKCTGGGHLIGTTRMSDSQASGVVDKNCQVFGLSNLFVAGSSIFPHGGAANPTLTISALAIRLANFLNNKD